MLQKHNTSSTGRLLSSRSVPVCCAAARAMILAAKAGHLLGAFRFVIYILSKIRAAKPPVRP